LQSRTGTVVAVTAAVLAVLTTTTAAAAPGQGNRSTDQGNPPAGWRLESSLGAQIAVPANWAVNDSGCGMTTRPSVVRGKGLQTLCYTAEPPTKELAVIEDAPKPGTATTIDGIAAQRGERRLSDGRYAGWVWVPSRRVTVEARTRDRATTERILHSVRLVDTDHLGCPTRPPIAAKTSGRSDFVPPDPTTVAVCYYGGKDRLQASAEIKDGDAHRLATALNTAPPGRNPNRPAETCDPRADRPGVDAILRMEDARMNGAALEGATVRIQFSSCTGRGMDNGARTAQVTRSVVETIMAPIHAGYSISGDLPA
jgi:hypothetical protein